MVRRCLRVVCLAAVVCAAACTLVDDVLRRCQDEPCVKGQVLAYLDGVLQLPSAHARVPHVDSAIFKRMARLLKTHEFRMRLPDLFGGAQLAYSVRDGLQVEGGGERALGLKKKLLLPLLLLLKLKVKALTPIFAGLLYLKAVKALILSKLAVALVLAFIVYQLLGKAGMKMPVTMTPIEPMPPVYGPPPSTPSSYEPGWEAATGGPYARVWTSNNMAAPSGDLAFNAYHPNVVSGSSP